MKGNNLNKSNKGNTATAMKSMSFHFSCLAHK